MGRREKEGVGVGVGGVYARLPLADKRCSDYRL